MSENEWRTGIVIRSYDHWPVYNFTSVYVDAQFDWSQLINLKKNPTTQWLYKNLLVAIQITFNFVLIFVIYEDNYISKLWLKTNE